ncbi:linear amide C-N hydrolase [Vibrio sp.]|uniref:linear amide C-N hydrolase n=1 Tax=Vibrio sp. TaxID=678 RepID=UPI003D0AABED
MKKSLLTTLISALAVTSAVGVSTSANACSRLVTETEYGTLLIRSADWVSTAPFDGQVSVFPVNTVREMRGEVKEYQNAYNKWQTKYHTISIEEHGAFNGLSGQTVNDKGLSVMALSQHDSEPYLKMHKDNGAPAVNVTDLPTFIAENYATTAEVKLALDNKEFQIAWASAPNGFEAPAPLHYSIVDRDGNIMLIQLGEGGVENVHLGDSSSDLKVKTNDPLQEEQRAYVAKFDLKDPKVASEIPWGIGGKDRNARLLALSEHMDLDGLNYAEVVGRQKSTFDVAALVPFGAQDPATGEDYPSFFTMQFNLDNGDIWFRSVMTGKEVAFNIEDTKVFTKPMHAEIQQQVDAGATEITWK